MLIRRPDDIPYREITPESLFWNRREFLSAAGTAAAGLALAPGAAYAGRVGGGFRQDDKPTPYESITHYNNYYEFGTDKESPAELASSLKLSPWSVRIEGEIAKPATYQLEDLLKPMTIQDRTYRHRCVEAWSMVIPWQGFQLRDLINRVQPTSRAKFVEFTTLYDPKQLPGQRRDVLPWPYVEALRMDEAMHPLTLIATGIYGKPLLGQNGAPLRLVVPWKYGFKGGKSVVRIRFLQAQPMTTWNIAAPDEYGFYANVNPAVDHPRWSQAKERRVGELFKRPTLPFNGYADQVASLYAGMNLQTNF